MATHSSQSRYLSRLSVCLFHKCAKSRTTLQHDIPQILASPIQWRWWHSKSIFPIIWVSWAMWWLQGLWLWIYKKWDFHKRMQPSKFTLQPFPTCTQATCYKDVADIHTPQQIEEQKCKRKNGSIRGGKEWSQYTSFPKAKHQTQLSSKKQVCIIRRTQNVS